MVVAAAAAVELGVVGGVGAGVGIGRAAGAGAGGGAVAVAITVAVAVGVVVIVAAAAAVVEVVVVAAKVEVEVQAEVEVEAQVAQEAAAEVVTDSDFHIGTCCGVTGFGYGPGMERVWIGVWIRTPCFFSSTRARQSRNRRTCSHSTTRSTIST